MEEVTESTVKWKPNQNRVFFCKIPTETEPSLCTWKPSQHYLQVNCIAKDTQEQVISYIIHDYIQLL